MIFPGHFAYMFLGTKIPAAVHRQPLISPISHLPMLRLTGIVSTISSWEPCLASCVFWISTSRANYPDMCAVDKELRVVGAVRGPKLLDAEKIEAGGCGERNGKIVLSKFQVNAFYI